MARSGMRPLAVAGLVAVALASARAAAEAAGPAGGETVQAMWTRMEDLQKETQRLLEEQARIQRALMESLDQASKAAATAASPPAATASPAASVPGAPVTQSTMPPAPSAFAWPRRIAFELGPDARNAPMRLFYLPDFLSPTECTHLLEVGEPRLAPSTVFTDDNEHSGLQQVVRSSLSGYIDNDDETSLVRAIVERFHHEAAIPRAFGESLQVTKYPVGTNYTFHYDSSVPLGRLATLLVFLNDVDEGGETVFPHSRLTNRGRAKLQLIQEGRARELALAGGDPYLVPNRNPLPQLSQTAAAAAATNALPARDAAAKAKNARAATLSLWDDEDEDEEDGGGDGEEEEEEEEEEEGEEEGEGDEQEEEGEDEEDVGMGGGGLFSRGVNAKGPLGAGPRRGGQFAPRAMTSKGVAAARAAKNKKTKTKSGKKTVSKSTTAKSKKGGRKTLTADETGANGVAGPGKSALPRIPITRDRLSDINMTAFCNSADVLRFKPRRGDGLLWFNHDMQLRMDVHSLHGGCTPHSGPKFITQRWMRWYPKGELNRLSDVVGGAYLMDEWDPSSANGVTWKA